MARADEMKEIAGAIADAASGDLGVMKAAVSAALNALTGLEDRIDNDIQKRWLSEHPFTVYRFGRLPGKHANLPPKWMPVNEWFRTEGDAKAWMQNSGITDEMRIVPSIQAD